jgi:Aspartyl protease
MRIRAVVAPLTALSLAVAPSCHRATPVPSGSSHQIALHPYFRGLRTVRAVVGDTAVDLLVDTGGGATLISPQLAASIGCRPFGRLVGHRMSSERVEFRLCEETELRIGDWVVSRRPVAVYDVNALLPAELPQLGGVLALDAFEGTVVTIDWAAGSIVVREVPAEGAAGALPLRFGTGEQGGTLVGLLPVSGSRGSLWFLLDSGDIRGTLVGAHVTRDSLLGIEDGRVSIRIPGRSPWTTSAGVPALDLDGVLGTSFLESRPVTLDLRVGVGAPTRRPER